MRFTTHYTLTISFLGCLENAAAKAMQVHFTPGTQEFCVTSIYSKAPYLAPYEKLHFWVYFNPESYHETNIHKHYPKPSQPKTKTVKNTTCMMIYVSM